MSEDILIKQEQNKSEQIYDQLKQYILSPDRESGKRLVSNRQLAKTLKTSTFPINKALKQLEKEGYIENRHGSGTYISSKHQPITMADTVTLCMEAQGHLWSELTSMFMEALARDSRVGMLLGMEATHDSKPELNQRMAHSESNTLIVQGGTNIPYDVFDLPGMKQKTVIAVLSWKSSKSWPGLCKVLHDCDAGAAMVADYLWSHGHRNVIITGTSTQLSHLEFSSPVDSAPAFPFRKRWEELGGKWSTMCSHASNVPGREILDENAFLALLDTANAPTAIFGLRDYEAWLAQGVLLRKRPDVLKSLDIIGYGNTPWSQASHFPFSTIDYNFEEIVAKSMAIIDSINSGEKLEYHEEYVKPKLITHKPMNLNIN